MDSLKRYNDISSTLKRISPDEGDDDFIVPTHYTHSDLEEIEEQTRLAKELFASLSDAQRNTARADIKSLNKFATIENPNPTQARIAKQAIQHLRTLFGEQTVGFFQGSAPKEKPVVEQGAPRPGV